MNNIAGTVRENIVYEDADFEQIQCRLQIRVVKECLLI